MVDGRLAPLERGDDLLLARLERPGGREHVVGVASRAHDRDAVRVGADEVAGLDADSASSTGYAERPGPAFAGPPRRGAEVEDRQAEPRDLDAVAHRAVEHDAGDAALLRRSATMSPQWATCPLAADREHDHVAGLAAATAWCSARLSPPRPGRCSAGPNARASGQAGSSPSTISTFSPPADAMRSRPDHRAPTSPRSSAVVATWSHIAVAPTTTP